MAFSLITICKVSGRGLQISGWPHHSQGPPPPFHTHTHKHTNNNGCTISAMVPDDPAAALHNSKACLASYGVFVRLCSSGLVCVLKTCDMRHKWGNRGQLKTRRPSAPMRLQTSFIVACWTWLFFHQVCLFCLSLQVALVSLIQGGTTLCPSMVRRVCSYQ